jgi:hypothetical protein
MSHYPPSLRPVTNDGETAENRRVKFFEQQPVANDVFNVVTHRREQENKKIPAVIAVAQRCESDLLRGCVADGRCLFLPLGCQHAKGTGVLELGSIAMME